MFGYTCTWKYVHVSVVERNILYSLQYFIPVQHRGSSNISYVWCCCFFTCPDHYISHYATFQPNDSYINIWYVFIMWRITVNKVKPVKLLWHTKYIYCKYMQTIIFKSWAFNHKYFNSLLLLLHTVLYMCPHTFNQPLITASFYNQSASLALSYRVPINEQCI